MAISDRVYQNKDVLDIFFDEDYPMFILLNRNTFSCGYFPILKKMTPKENI
jgi:hypothetical protein